MSFAAAIAALRTLTNPYPGLRPFETSESHLFFGRDQQVAELVARLERNRFLAVVGVSGSGKSSLVRAGLIPALERGRVLEAGRRWRMVVTRPGGAPLQRLAADLERAGLDATPLTQSSHGLIEVARGLSSDESLLVLVDQFEELFRYKDLPATTEEARLRRGVSASEAAEFVQLLLEAARHSHPVYIVLTMRSDYLGDCAEFRDLPETLNDCQYLIPRMTRAQRKEAIGVPLGPVAMAPSLTQRLLNDAGDEPDQLPVLQHALMRTWARWRATDPEQTRRIELADYESIGGFQNAIDLHAEEVLAGVSDQGIAENIFKRLTATGRGNRERRDPATLDELCAVCGATSPEARVGVMAVIDAFRLGEATFLTPRDGDITGATYVDITHESLIRQWRRLRDVWLPGEQQSAKAFLTLAERARNWDAGKAEPLAGLDLAGALEWNRRRNPTVAWVEHYGDAKDLELVLRFIAASRVHDRKLRLRRRGLWIALPLVFVFASLAGVAVWQAVRAAELREESRGGKLLARSQLLLTTDPNLTPSVLLAIEALSRLRSAEAEEALRHAVARVPRQLFQVPLAVAAAGQDTPRDKERRDRIVTSIDGRSVAVVADDGHVSVLEAQTGRQIGTMKAPAPVFDIAPGSDGTWMIATAASDGSPSLISFPDGREIRRLTAAGRVTAVALSRDGRFAATVGADAWRLHDLSDGRELGPPTLVTDGSTPVFSADGNTIAMGGREKDTPGSTMGGQDTPGSIYTSRRQETRPPAYRAFVFDTARQKPTIKYALAGKVQSLALTRDGRFLVAGDAGAARVWDLTDGSEPSRMPTGTALASVAISDDARVVVTAGADGTSRAFDTHGGAEIARATIECPAKPAPDGSTTAPETPPCGARAVALSPDGRVVFSVGDDGMLRVFEALGTSDEARITMAPTVRGIAFARAGRRLVVVGAEEGFGAVHVFDADGWRESARAKPEKPEINGLAVSADGRFVVIASNWSTGPTLFDLDAPQKGPRELGGPSSPYPPSMALSGDGSSAAWISRDRAMRIDVAGGTPLALPDLIQTQAIALSDDGRTAAVGTGNNEVGEVVVLQIPAGTPTARVPFVGPPTFLAISPDGRWVAASKGIQGMGDNTIHVIDASAGQIRWKHAGAPNTPIAFTRDGRTVAMASADGTLRTFETASGRETFRIALDEQLVMALAFDEQAASLTAASVIGTLPGSGVTVKKYLLRRHDVVTQACSRLSRNLTKPEWTRYVGADATHNATCAALRLGEQ